MEQLIQAFGIDLKGIVVQLINFVILMGVLSYFLYKPVLKLLADREDQIKQGIADAEAAAEARANAETDRKEVLTSAHKEAEEIASRAKASADERTTEAIKVAESKAAEIVSAAERKGKELKEQAHKESEAEIAKLAVLAAEKVLKEKAS